MRIICLYFNRHLSVGMLWSRVCAWSVKSGRPEKNLKSLMLGPLHVVSPATSTPPSLVFWYRWHTGSWGPCSATCGVGIQTREVHCLYPGESPAPPEECRDEKPHALQACSQFDCPPSWHIEEWQQVQQTGDPTVRHARGRSSPDPPPSVSSVFQDLWRGDSEPKSHVPAAVNGRRLLESLR